MGGIVGRCACAVKCYLSKSAVIFQRVFRISIWGENIINSLDSRLINFKNIRLII